MPATDITAEMLARKFHETYERVAPQFGYKTRKRTRVPWSEVPEDNRELMLVVALKVLEDLIWPKSGQHILSKNCWCNPKVVDHRKKKHATG